MWVGFAYADSHSNSDTNSNGNWHGNSNRHAIWDTNSYSECHCHADRYTRTSNYANAPASPDSSASAVGPRISNDGCFADG